jgi:hypothetical protein
LLRELAVLYNFSLFLGFLIIVEHLISDVLIIHCGLSFVVQLKELDTESEFDKSLNPVKQSLKDTPDIPWLFWPLTCELFRQVSLMLILVEFCGHLVNVLIGDPKVIK